MEDYLLLVPIIGIVLGLVVLILFVRWCVNHRRVVPTNFVHIVQSRRKTSHYGGAKPPEAKLLSSAPAGRAAALRAYASQSNF